MTARNILHRGGVAAGGVLLFLFFSYLFFPAERIDALIDQQLAPQGVKLSPPVRKSLLPGLVWKNLQLSVEQGVIIRSDRFRVRPLLLPLLWGRVILAGNADIGNGRLKTEYSPFGKEAVNISVEGVNLSDIPFFKTIMGARVSGGFKSDGKLTRSPKGLNGDLKLEVSQLELAGVKLGAFPLPDASRLRTQGLIRFTDGRARLESFTLEGDGIYMRLSGELPSGANAGVTPLAMVLEIMPKPEFLEKQKLVFLVLSKFMTAPGVYKVPIRGTLLKPEIM